LTFTACGGDNGDTSSTPPPKTAVAPASGDVVARLRVAAGAGDDHAVKRRVDLAVAALVEPLAVGVA
jgi:hypothetical protein